ncbi:phosphoadenosine phosphosulfate reductase [Novosphingobium chloroacetimidivorans]|uniref:Adenosine 5'-phosphosulfate reductase n=1 Tax=Novosphingobium chloroacetimidivorans TaxID=1428314 RepID=A0A7W7KCA1_9SPHN|nr:phosphoadenylyl-sulfate reductase [Novosphingobium chloroacetimidivorans]MBB4860204.1 phosphoadenosine phosphosulfate reductase [Novosphingobium chloroacetimidivorans]
MFKPVQELPGQDQTAIAPAERTRDRIDTSARFQEADAVRLNRLFRGTETVEMLETLLREQMAGDVAIVSSFGAESAVLLHLVSRIDPSVPVLFLDTGKHFPETLAYRDELVARLGLTNVINLTPDAEDLAKRDDTGLRWSYDPDGCCEIRKVKPLAKALAGYDATITGRKAFQASTRATLPRFEIDTTDAQGRLKINPLIDWSAEDLAAYIAEHDLPPHPLVAEGYPSIGCSPCTSKVAPGEDPRSGRWKGWDKVECGIHVPGGTSDISDLPPGYEPAF